jgi:nucleotidyltransferase/DNA polymerase involved in DNA repair
VESTRVILHVDMDAFFASVEQLDHPEARGKPVLVGGDGPRGVVSAASYEARVFGCRSAQPMAVAKRLCPHAIVMHPRFGRYREISDRVFEILGRFTPLVEPVSVDEAFLDCTGSTRLFGDGEAIARQVRGAVRDETRLSASVGVAPNKFLAKLASDLDKPDGLTVIRPDEIDRVLAPLPVGRIWGIGGKTVERLASAGVRTIADLRHMPPQWFHNRFGQLAERIHRLAHGIDDRAVTPDSSAKSIGQEHTFGADLSDRNALREVLLAQAEQVASRLRRHRYVAQTVTVKLRYGDFETITRRRTLPGATDVTTELYAVALAIFDEWAASSFQPVRLIGMTCSHLQTERQLELFDQPQRQKQQHVDRALDAIRAKFGSSSIHRGGPRRTREP